MTATPPAPARDVPSNMADRLIVALDVKTPEAASDLVDRLDGTATFFKIGMWLLFAKGTDALIDRLVDKGNNVFLDYKMYDIGQTVKEGVARARERGAKIVTIHGDDAIMKAAVEGKGGDAKLKLFAITVLTSMNDDDLAGMGYRLTVPELVELRVRKAAECGVDGVIASAADNPAELRRRAGAPGLLIGTPGVRSPGVAVHDQKRVATPEGAIRAGADYIVMGRQITEAADPAAEARKVIAEMERGAAPAA
ncbi:orotidine-5'-phosphate decarboxylase [Hansschlegelia sp. KR7-227]|uniref:orotidine-5'-phosphate decarboxylase n=1 Tax=Hansschlegelia sp. KR7-227 TaxID=3400914 RepID=UPI003C1218F5